MHNIPRLIICQQNANMRVCIRSIHLHSLLNMLSLKDTPKSRIHGNVLVRKEKFDYGFNERKRYTNCIDTLPKS